MKMFSRPEISGWKPAPSSIRAEMRPWVTTSPAVGLLMPARIFSSVLLPEPFSPMMPRVCPAWTSNDTPRRASKRSPASMSPNSVLLTRALLMVRNLWLSACFL